MVADIGRCNQSFVLSHTEVNHFVRFRQNEEAPRLRLLDLGKVLAEVFNKHVVVLSACLHGLFSDEPEAMFKRFMNLFGDKDACL